MPEPAHPHLAQPTVPVLPTLCPADAVDGLKSTAVEIFISWKLVNATNQGSF